MRSRKNCVMPCCEMRRHDLVGVVAYAFQRNTRYQFARVGSGAGLLLSLSFQASLP